MAEQTFTDRVLRPFKVDGKMRNGGDLVDSSSWKNRHLLREQRYIAPLDSPLAASASGGDPKLIQEEIARRKRRAGNNEDGGGIASMAEVTRKAGEDVGEGDQQPATALKGKLPEDFPGHPALVAASLTSYGKLRTFMKSNDLTSVPNIGDATAAKIEEIMGASTDNADEEEDGAGSEGSEEAQA